MDGCACARGSMGFQRKGHVQKFVFVNLKCLVLYISMFWLVPLQVALLSSGRALAKSDWRSQLLVPTSRIGCLPQKRPATAWSIACQARSTASSRNSSRGAGRPTAHMMSKCAGATAYSYCGPSLDYCLASCLACLPVRLCFHGRCGPAHY